MSTLKSSKLVVILGPTSSGKSALAIDAAKQWNGEVISTDSRQVYRGMDIGSGKVTKKEQRIVPHHLLDVADPNDDYNISHFLRDARTAIGDIASRDKLPIVCGGTGFWIQALIENQALPDTPPNSSLRMELSRKTPEELFEILQELDSARAETIDRKNPRRLIRAIEIAKDKNQESSIKNQKEDPIPKNARPFNHKAIQPYTIALCPPKDILDARIRARLEARFSQGMIAEVESLHTNGVSWERLDSFGLEYRWISRFLRGMVDEAGMKERLFFDSVHYAKRQMTWIRRWKRLGAPLTVVKTATEAAQKINTYLEEKRTV
ncbi:MAG: tRNA (adenosine(37)-N6)-dimethylallyltransferase MiaA [Candidatus Moraniibacteriota bacterium]|nr:MAG: tRNA (adenosine(37)-N6)-dimethylallyltransferase MiaA [Candidatus Moranbacteria bacterium]